MRTNGGLTMRVYEDFVDHIAIYPNRLSGKFSDGVVYCALGMNGEAGEFADKVKKILRDKEGVLEADDREALLNELGDVLWYVAAMAGELDSSLEEVAVVNIEKLKARQKANTLQGEGDNR